MVGRREEVVAVERELARARSIQAVAATQLTNSGLSVSSALEAADPRQYILEEAHRFGADCIVLGAVGELTFERFLFGTVVAAVTTRASCSVEVVREAT